MRIDVEEVLDAVAEIANRRTPCMFLALLLGTAVLLVSLLSFGIVMSLTVQLVVWLIRTGYTGLVFRKNVAVMVIVLLVTAAAHLLQIALWAAALLLLGEVSSFEQGFYCSAEQYTALGHGKIELSERWRLLGPLEAINGLLVFGLSTAVLFALMSRLITNRLHLQQGDPGKATQDPEPS
jgi:hypothetical protein